jgi:CheY-like chemotaxis protein
MEFGKTIKVVLLAEFGEAIPDSKLSILAMPVYSISIANILNGVSESFNLSENDKTIWRFTAPDAKVLVVDDVSTNLKVAQGLMTPYRMQVDLCKSGHDAILALTEKRYDLVFMDHKMPDMDGIETTALIREMGEKEPYYKNLPVIALTANAVLGAKEIFLNSGFNGYLSKPIDMIKLNNVLEKWIPKNKQKHSSIGSGEVSAEKIGKMSEKINIEGLDTEQGIFLSGGTKESYLETLALFYKDGMEKINEISGSLDKGNLDMYTIHVHALKSAAANIGADELSEDAAALEQAGEIRDKEYIALHTPGFLAMLETILNSIMDFLAREEGDAGSCDMEGIKSELAILKGALETFDAGTINKTVDTLGDMARAGAIKKSVQGISEKILIGEYKEALAAIQTLLNEGDNNGKKDE